MAQPGSSKRLSAQDASFLYFEKKEAPLHIGSIGIFEGQVDYAQFVENLSAKINLIPRYQQIVVPAPLNIGHPTWEWDQAFDIRRHVMRAEIDAPGTDAQLHELAARLFAPMMDRNKPLWEMYLINGIEGDRSALVTKVHHCLVDGVSGIELLMLVLDVSQTPIPPAPAPELEKPAPEPPFQRLVEAVLDNVSEDIDRIARQGQFAVDAALGETRPRAMLRALETSAPYFQVPVQRAPFNKPFGGGRQAAFCEYSFPEIRQIRQAAGGTVNDVVLTVLGGGMGKYLEMHGQSTQGRSARVLTPVNVRRDNEVGALGNRVSMLLVEVPVGIPDPLERLATVCKRTEALKRRNVADGIEGMGQLMNAAPPMLQAFLGTLPTPSNTFANMVCTNVPGPMIPLYNTGHRMLQHLPLIPLGFEMGISLGVTSYDQRLFFGFMADTKAANDVDRLRYFADQSYVELRSAAGVEKLDLPVFGIPPLAPEANANDASRRRRAAGSPSAAFVADAG